MKQISLSKWLKFIIFGVGICGLVVYAWVVPMLGQTIVAAQDGAIDGWFWPWLCFLWATGIPCYLVLACAWKIAANIGADQSFSMANAKLLTWISALAAGDAAFFFLGNLVYLLLNINHPVIVLLSFLVVFAGIAVSIASAVMSHLVRKAAELQEQSDLTI